MNNGRIKLLLVEDDLVDQMAFKRLVKTEKLAYEYQIAGSISEALKILPSNEFQLVVSDFWLGDGTAFDLCDLQLDLPIIIITGSGDEEIAVKAMKAGAYDYLIKEPERNYLKVLPLTIDKVLDRWQVEKQIRMLSHSMKSINDCVFITDPDDNIIFVNKAFCKTYQYSTEAIVGKKCNILWKNEEEAIEICKKQNYDEDVQYEFYHKRKDRTEFPIFLSRSLIKDENEHGFAVVYVVRDITEKKKAEQEREKLITELQNALRELKVLNGLLPICASCKKIRDDKGYWNQIEAYIQAHSNAEFSHSLCPECAKALYPDIFKDKYK